MSAKRKVSSRISNPRDIAPEITEAWIEGADLYDGERLVRRGRPTMAEALEKAAPRADRRR